MEVLFFSAFALSLAVAAQPGVIGFEALRRGVTNGWSAALQVELGSLVGDGVWAALALLGASILFQNRLVALLLGLFGCGLLLRFAWNAWRASRSEVEFVNAGGQSRQSLRSGRAVVLVESTEHHRLAVHERHLDRLWIPQPAAYSSLGFLLRIHDRASLLVLLFCHSGRIRSATDKPACVSLDKPCLRGLPGLFGLCTPCANLADGAVIDEDSCLGPLWERCSIEEKL